MGSGLSIQTQMCNIRSVRFRQGNATLLTSVGRRAVASFRTMKGRCCEEDFPQAGTPTSPIQ
jgi:hypothetical protein